jgi:PAS domain S-box-containing protein
MEDSRAFHRKRRLRGSSRERGAFESPATRVTAAYVVLACGWILLSDWALGALASPEEVRSLQTLKGWLFVVVTGALLWFVLHGDWRARQRALQRQEESEVRLDAALEALEATIIRFRSQAPHEILSVSEGIAGLSGHAPEDLTGEEPRSALELVHPDDRLRVFTAVRASARDGRRFVLELRLLTRDGEVRWVWCKGRPTAEGDAVEVFLTDVSRLKRLEGQLVQAHGLEALAELAAGVAHDINNFLTALVGHVDLALESAASAGAAGLGAREAAAVARHLSQARQAVEQAMALNQRLVRIGRPQGSERQRIDLNELVESVGALLLPMLRQRVDLVCDRHPAPVVLEADPRQLEQVLVNLAVNARDAMPEGGLLTLSAALVEVDERSAGPLRDLAPGRYGAIVVADTGTGIPPEHRERIFEPFFTTKPPEAGSGLGLAVVAALVDQHGGRITVESAEAAGTTFRVFLPIRETGPDDEGTAEPPQGGGGSPVWSY